MRGRDTNLGMSRGAFRPTEGPSDGGGGGQHNDLPAGEGCPSKGVPQQNTTTAWGTKEIERGRRERARDHEEKKTAFVPNMGTSARQHEGRP